jgi:hypothetical protein
MGDVFSDRFAGLLTGSYDCVDRIVLNAYFSVGSSPGGFRTWWRRLHGNDADLDNAHLLRMAGRFSRRVRGWAKSNGVPVIDCGRGERKHLIAQEYLAAHTVAPGVFLVLVGRAPVPVWDVKRSPDQKVIWNLAKKSAYVNHYSFHIMDPAWGHVVIKMSSHPPFGAQVILNGHEYVACTAQRAGVDFVKENNCFTRIADPVGLAQIAVTLSSSEAVGRLGQVIDRWIYTAALCFGVDLADQDRTCFRYSYSVYQVEYSRNLLFASGAVMDRVFNTLLDRVRSRLDVPRLRTLFGAKARPRDTGEPSMKLATTIERPSYDLTIFKIHFGLLTVKAYTKGERVLRFEAITHNTKSLGCGRVLDKFGDIVTALADILERFMSVVDCLDAAFIPDGLLDDLSRPGTIAQARTAGITLEAPRMRAMLAAVIALAPLHGGFTVADLVAKIRATTGDTTYTTRQAAYDLRKLRAKHLIDKPGRTRSYHVPDHAARAITALLTLREHVIAPILTGTRDPGPAGEPATLTLLDRHYQALRTDMQALFTELGIATLPRAA